MENKDFWKCECEGEYIPTCAMRYAEDYPSAGETWHVLTGEIWCKKCDKHTTIQSEIDKARKEGYNMGVIEQTRNVELDFAQKIVEMINEEFKVKDINSD